MSSFILWLWRRLPVLPRQARAREGPLRNEPCGKPPIEQVAYDLRRLDHQRHSGPAKHSEVYLAAVLQAYDSRLVLASRVLGVVEHLEPLEGIDRELERLRVESALEHAGLVLRDHDHPAVSSNVLVKQPQVSDAAPSGEQKPAASIKKPKRKKKKKVAALAPTEPATRMIEVVVSILPHQHRARYSEEFRSELHDLAQAGASRVQQFAYALRLFDRVWVLRAELRPPKRARG